MEQHVDLQRLNDDRAQFVEQLKSCHLPAGVMIVGPFGFTPIVWFGESGYKLRVYYHHTSPHISVSLWYYHFLCFRYPGPTFDTFQELINEICRLSNLEMGDSLNQYLR